MEIKENNQLIEKILMVVQILKTNLILVRRMETKKPDMTIKQETIAKHLEQTAKSLRIL